MNEKEIDKRRLTDPNTSLDKINQQKYMNAQLKEINAFYIRNQLYDRLALLQYKSRKRREKAENESLSRSLRKKEENE